jgi:hypothetical protein
MSTIQKNHEIIYGTHSSDVPVRTENVPKFIAVRNLSMCVISTSIFNFHLPDMSLQLNSTMPIIAGFRRCVNEICALLEFTQRRIAVLHRRFGRIYRSLEYGTDRLYRNVGNTTILRCVNSRTVKISWSHTAQTMVHYIQSFSFFNVHRPMFNNAKMEHNASGTSSLASLMTNVRRQPLQWARQIQLSWTSRLCNGHILRPGYGKFSHKYAMEMLHTSIAIELLYN